MVNVTRGGTVAFQANKILPGAMFVGAFFLASFAGAQTLRSSCYLVQDGKSQLSGTQLNKRLEIASVSKIMTAHWAFTKYGPNHRFETRFVIREAKPQSFDVHIMGGYDPYFSRFQFQYLAAELNRLGIQKIEKLSFDSKFKYLDATRSSGVAAGFYTIFDPTPGRVAQNLKLTLNTLTAGYDLVVAKAKRYQNVSMPEQINLSVGNIEYQEGVFELQSTDRIYSLKSAELVKIAKEFNRNSNNYATNVIFEGLGGEAEYAKFIQERLQLTQDDIRFVNGSGDRRDYEGAPSKYNEATCQAVIHVLMDLKNVLEHSGYKLWDVLAVAGADPDGEESSVGRIYTNQITDHSLIAKTGTVNPSISLAGMVTTSNGDVLFHIVYTGSPARNGQRKSRDSIRKDVIKLIQGNGGKKPIETQTEYFMPFDEESQLVAVGLEH